MKTEDLRELMEMTGLTTESAGNKTSAPVFRGAIDGAKKVGIFAKVGKNYGLIDEELDCGFGFVHSEGDSWTGQIVQKEQITVCSGEEDIEKAKQSALHYYVNEFNSLDGRLKMNYACDKEDRERIEALAQNCFDWLVTIANM